jgi:hypothetical protein
MVVRQKKLYPLRGNEAIISNFATILYPLHGKDVYIAAVL